MKQKALALLLPLLLAAGLCSAAFADGLDSSAPGDGTGLVETYGQPVVPVIPVATEGQIAPAPEVPSEPEPETPEIPQDEPGTLENEDTQQETENPENPDNPQTPENSENNNEPPKDKSPPDELENTENPENPESTEPPIIEPEDSGEVIGDIPYIPEDRGDVFAVRSLLRIPEVHVDPPASTIGDDKDIKYINIGNGKPWIPDRGIPKGEGATISSSTSLFFAIPDDNFNVATSGTTSMPKFDDKIAYLNSHYKSKVEVKYSGKNYVPDNFDVQFVSVSATNSGRAFGVQLTPKSISSSGLELPKNTTFGFEGQTDCYKLDNDLLIVPGNSSSARATGINQDAYLGFDYTWVTINGSAFDGDFEDIDAKAGDEILIHFSPQFFTWKDDIIPAKATLTNIRSKISLRQTGTSNSRVFEAVELTTSKGEAVVRIKFRDDLISTKPMDFKTKLTLAVSGKRDENKTLDIAGTFGDDEPVDFYSEDREIDISDGVVGVAAESMSMVKVYIGEGVTLTVPHIRKNAKFYGTVITSFDKYDEELVELYPDIVEVYKLRTLGLNGAGVKVDIDTYNGLHVYDKELNYLGQSTRKLEYCETYYLAENMLDIEVEEEEEPWDEYEPDNDVPPSQNPNKNPGTGK